MKIRILNGGHAAIAYPAGLLDIHFVHEAMADEQIRAFLEKLTKTEIQPVVPPPPNTKLDEYPRTDRAALRQSEDRRHDPTPLLRRLEPAAEVHSALRRRSAECRRALPGSRARVGSVVPLLLRRDREWQRGRAQRSELGAHSDRREASAQRSARFSRAARHLRQACGRTGLCQRLFQRALRALGGWRSLGPWRLFVEGGWWVNLTTSRRRPRAQYLDCFNQPQQQAYCNASKAGVHHLMKSLATPRA